MSSYKCSICSKRFESDNSLRVHFGHHKKGDPSAIGRFKCEFCEKAFHQKQSLKWHLEENHSKLKN